MYHSVAAGPGAAPLRAAWSRPEKTALAAAEALGWVPGWAEPNSGGCMGMEAAAGQWTVCWYPGGRPKEKQGEGEILTPQEHPQGSLVRASHPVKLQPSSAHT